MTVDMEIFRQCLRQQLLAHPSMLPKDVVKLCYQTACGAEHLLSDAEGAKRYFEEEYASVSPSKEPLYEQISAEICRVNLGAWKRAGLPSERLFRIFAETVFRGDGKNRLNAYLGAAEMVLREMDFDMAAWEEFLVAYEKAGMPAVRHSEQYRAAEHPAYRIVSMEAVAEILEKN